MTWGFLRPHNNSSLATAARTVRAIEGEPLRKGWSCAFGCTRAHERPLLHRQAGIFSDLPLRFHLDERATDTLLTAGVKMKRQLFNLSAALSLVLFIATAALWARTIWRPMYILVRPVTLLERGYLIYANEGRLALMVLWVGSGEKRQENEHELAGFRVVRRSEIVVGQNSTAVEAPFWFLVIISGALPSWWALNARRRRRLRRLEGGRCVKCGYDLRATPDRCPECGAAARAV